jgi:class 3 adenylate cyclase
MTTSDLTSELGAYVPNWVKARILDNVGNSEPSTVSRPTAILFIDIAGFTEITDRLARQGERGAEQLSELLNDCFAVLTDIVHAQGGDIAAFTGDGILAIWVANELAIATHRAAQCALALHAAMNSWTQANATDLPQRILIDAGEVCYCKLGGYAGVWRYLVAGKPFQNVGVAYRKARIGDVLLCEPAWRVIADVCDGEFDGDTFRVTGLKATVDVTPLPAPTAAAACFETLVPEVVVDRLRVGALKWLGEFRHLTVLCINFLDSTFTEELLKSLHGGILKVQRIVAGLEGVIFNLLMDDKGICAVLTFGAPPFAHEDDALRAIQAAVRIFDELKEISIRASIGISSGKLFCGTYGGRSRREYGVFGPSINTAARLMQLDGGGVVCDAQTAQAVGASVAFSVLRSQRVKGRIEPIPAYRPIGFLPKQHAHDSKEMIGRDAERRKLLAHVEQFQNGIGGIVVIRGEPGIGKSRLLADFFECAQAKGIPTFKGHASAIESSTPYFAWRSILSVLTNTGPTGGNANSLETLRAKLRGSQTLIDWLPLLNDILSIGLVDTSLTAEITGAARAASIETLMVALLNGHETSPPIILFEDLHWFDSASWSLLKGVVRQLPGVLVVATARSLDTTRGTLDLEKAMDIKLGDLSSDAVAELIRRRLRAVDVSPALVSFVQARAGGNPLYCEELVSALHDTGAISSDRGVCHPAIESLNATKLVLPTSLEGAIVARVDALRVEAQLLLKVASTIGGPFGVDILHEIYPRLLSIEETKDLLDYLVDRDFLVSRKDGALLQYEFFHAINEEVTYRLLPFAQRRLLHGSIAAAIERKQATDLEPYYAQLAWHWEHAEDRDRAVEYLERAAERALRNYANKDAIRYVQKAFELSENTMPESESARLSRWETILGDAYNELADYNRSWSHYERAMTLLGQRLIHGGTERAVSILKNMLGQALLRLVPARPNKLSGQDRDLYQRAAHIRERMAERHFFRNESAAVLDETLAALNLAERCGATTEMVSGYSALALGLGMSGFRTPARFYRARAITLAERREVKAISARAYLLAAVLGYGTGEWEFTDRCAGRALWLYRQLGDRGRAHAPLTVQLFSAILRGRIERAAKLLDELGDATKMESTAQGKAWYHAAKVLISVIRGNSDLGDLRQLSEAISADLVRADQLLCLGIAASGYLQCGELQRAVDAAERGLAALKEAGIVWGSYVYGVSGIIEVLLARWSVDSEARTLVTASRAKALQALEYGKRVTRTSAVCQPQCLLLEGRMASLSGQPTKARRMWMAASRAAERLDMRRERGLALYEIGCISKLNDPRRSSYLANAAEIFESLDARADLMAARQAMSPSAQF